MEKEIRIDSRYPSIDNLEKELKRKFPNLHLNI